MTFLERGGGRREYQRRDDAPSSVVSGADYEEVNQESQRRGGYQPRTKRQQRQADRCDYFTSLILQRCMIAQRKG